MTDIYIIESHIPPPSDVPRLRRSRYAALNTVLCALEIGDSILMPSNLPYAYILAMRIGITITVRKTREGFRLWRIHPTMRGYFKQVPCAYTTREIT